MNLEDFSHAFDTQVNSYAYSPQFGDEATRQTLTFDEYEKSLWLTKAEREVVLSLYNGKNTYGESFEETEEQRRYLSNLIREAKLDPIENSSEVPLGIDSMSSFFTLPEDVWFITYEAIDYSGGKCGGIRSMEVVPATQDEYHRMKKNPFRGANDRRALRLDLADGVIEIVCKYNVENYYLRYLKKIDPIVLIDLPDNLTIDGVQTATECEVHEGLHNRILDMAVAMAVQSKNFNMLSN